MKLSRLLSALALLVFVFPQYVASQAIEVPPGPDMEGVYSYNHGDAMVKAIPANPQRSCARLLYILENINPSAENPVLIKLRPGIYDCGEESIAMKPFVEIKGSGQNNTFLRGSFTSPPGSMDFMGVVNGANDAELRNLTVENTCDSGGSCVAILAGSTSMSIRQVTAVARSSGTVRAIGAEGTVMLEDVTAIAETATISVSRAVSVGGGSVEMNNVTAISLGGVTGSSGLSVLGTATATARNSRFRGFFYGVNNAPNATLNLISTQLDGGRSSGATYNCVGAYDGNFNALDGNCDPIP